MTLAVLSPLIVVASAVLLILLERRYPYAQLLLASIENAKLRPVTAHYWSFSKVFRQVMEEMLNTDRPIDKDQIERLQLALKGKLTS